MIGIFDEIAFYFTMPNVRYAMIVSIIIALCSSLLGITLVLKRYSFIGTGLSNVAFGATAIGAAMSLSSNVVAEALNLTNNMLLVLPVTIICAIVLLRSGRNVKVKGDAALAMIASGSLGLGYLILNIFPPSGNLAGDICTILFGSWRILTLTTIDLWLSIGLSIVVIAVFLIFYHKIFAITFDNDFIEAIGVNAKLYNLILAVVIAVVIVLAMNLVGALLVSALVVFPAMSAMRVFKSFKSVTICSVIVSIICAVLGMLIAIIAGTPVGATIVAANIAGFILMSLAGLIREKAGT